MFKEKQEIQYKKFEDGSIDWRSMIPEEFIKVNKGAFKDGNVPTSTEGLADNQLLILLGGIKWAAKARGLISRQTKVDYVTDHRAVCTVTLTFKSNEDNPDGLVYSDVGAASVDNTSGFGRMFLETIAANRAFVRAVRNALNINIVGQDEIAPANNSQPSNEEESGEYATASSMKPHKVLEDKAVKYFKKKEGKVITFQEFKEYVSSKGVKKVSPETWGESWDSVPGEQCFILMAKLNG